jgi:membrane associated rhomboid family serine protease
MLPLRDTIHSDTFPIINWTLMGLNGLLFLFELSLPREELTRFIYTYGVVADRIDLTQPWLALLTPTVLISLITHMFLHGGWFHFLSNMWILYIFGDNVEDRMGPTRYLFFYLASGLVAALVQVWFSPGSQTPAIGASGAIAGVLGAYFLLYPRARVITLIPVFFFPWFLDIPALFYLGFWFISQLFSGVASLGMPASVGGIAWWAHIGGFVFGMLFYRLFTPRRDPVYTRRYPDEYYPW